LQVVHCKIARPLAPAVVIVESRLADCRRRGWSWVARACGVPKVGPGSLVTRFSAPTGRESDGALVRILRPYFDADCPQRPARSGCSCITRQCGIDRSRFVSSLSRTRTRTAFVPCFALRCCRSPGLGGCGWGTSLRPADGRSELREKDGAGPTAYGIRLFHGGGREWTRRHIQAVPRDHDRAGRPSADVRHGLTGPAGGADEHGRPTGRGGGTGALGSGRDALGAGGIREPQRARAT
jgi:hypothetical protein